MERYARASLARNLAESGRKRYEILSLLLVRAIASLLSPNDCDIKREIHISIYVYMGERLIRMPASEFVLAYIYLRQSRYRRRSSGRCLPLYDRRPERERSWANPRFTLSVKWKISALTSALSHICIFDYIFSALQRTSLCPDKTLLLYIAGLNQDGSLYSKQWLAFIRGLPRSI